ncbi:MAG: hypothetical protein COZ24_02665 [Hydrogenophilales bacterium CG_4_10_14_3_um_filter_63_21]|nr:MAG: hypothetical protein COZ24_02665 [Hydrogenophilales bacterium CG_4_10_14_3_um_filter_63_21]
MKPARPDALAMRRIPAAAAAALPLIITGTIIPQASFVHIADWQVRRQQYLEALRYFCERGYRVFFLENSAYDMDADPDFAMAHLTTVKLRDEDASGYQRGKGYQEFKMLDRFLASEQAPQRFFKLSGRRTLHQISYFQNRYRAPGRQWFDLWQNDAFADTTFFCCDLDFYDQHLRALYAQADDGSGRIIEKVVYAALHGLPAVRFHPLTPLFTGQHGTSGNKLKGKYHFPTEMRRKLRSLLGKHKLDKRILDWPRAR